jgi:hypothetical protein
VAIRADFEHAFRIDVDLVDPQISVSDTSATVTFVRGYTLQPQSGSALHTNSATTMTLRRSDTSWVIEQIRFGLR